MNIPPIPRPSALRNPDTMAYAIDLIGHAIIVILVVVSASILTALHAISSDVVSTVYGGAIGYAGGRSGSNRRRRKSDYTA